MSADDPGLVPTSELLALAENATPGPWSITIECGDWACIASADALVVPSMCIGPDAHYVAAADPTTIATLCRRTGALDKGLTKAHDALAALRCGKWEIGYVHEIVDRILAAARELLEGTVSTCWCGAAVSPIASGVLGREWCHEHAPRCRSGAHFHGNCKCEGL